MRYSAVFFYLFSCLICIGAFVMTRAPDIGSNLTLFNTGFIILSIGYIGCLMKRFQITGRVWWFVVGVIILVTRITALNLYPSDDIARYIWEGRLIREGYSPYSISPDDPQLTYLRDSEIYPVINHKDMPAIYPPLSLYLFAGIGLITNSFSGFRLFTVIVELLAIVLMIFWLKSKNIERNKLLIYAFNPLVILGISGHGHLDSIQIFFITGGLLAWSKQREGLAMTLISLSGLVKILGFFALPFLVNRRTLKYLPFNIILIICSFLPFCFMKGGLSFGNLGVFLGEFEYYSFLFFPLRMIFGTWGTHFITIVILCFFLFWLYLTRAEPAHAIAPFFILVTLMSTTIHYWYLVPLLALVTVWRSYALIGLSLLFLPYFHVFQEFVISGEWLAEWWRQIITYSGFTMLLIIEWIGFWPAFSKNRPSTGIVIPVLNDGRMLKNLLAQLEKNNIQPGEVIIADGGSTDNSLLVAEQWGVRVVSCSKKGRGNQIAEGIKGLSSDIVLILHADKEIPYNFINHVRRIAAAYPDAPGGAFALRYSMNSFRYKIISLLSTARMALFGLGFGDQAQWFRRARVDVPSIPLMEDVELAVRMNDQGRTVWGIHAVSVSQRRYSAIGSIPLLFDVIKRTVGYLFYRRWYNEMPDTYKMYYEYYQRHQPMDL